MGSVSFKKTIMKSVQITNDKQEHFLGLPNATLKATGGTPSDI
jgi:hypothetical protein